MPEINLGLAVGLLDKLRYNTGVARGSLTPQGTKAPDPVLGWFSRDNYKKANAAFNDRGWTSSLNPVGAGPAYPEVNFQQSKYTTATNGLTEQEKVIVQNLSTDIKRASKVMDTFRPGRYRDEPNTSRRKVVVADVLSFFPVFFTDLSRLKSLTAWDGGVVNPLGETYFFGSNYFIDTPETQSEYNWRIGGQVIEFDATRELANPAEYIDLLDYGNNKKYFSLSNELSTTDNIPYSILEVSMRQSIGQTRSAWFPNRTPWELGFDGFTVSVDVRWHEPKAFSTLQGIEFEFLIESEESPTNNNIFQVYWAFDVDEFVALNPKFYPPTCYMSINGDIFYGSSKGGGPNFEDTPTDYTSWGYGDGDMHRFSFCFNRLAKEFVVHRDGILVFRAEFTKDLPQIPSPYVSATVKVGSIANRSVGAGADRTQRPEAGIGDCELSLLPLYSRGDYTVPDLQEPE